MKRKVLYPIKKEYVSRFFDGSKAYEFRKRLCSDDVDTIVIYESNGRGKIVGEMQVVGRIACPPQRLWELTKDYAGIQEDEFFRYFKDCEVACAYVIGDINVFVKPRKLADYGVNAVPQNYVYLNKINYNGRY